MFTIVRSLACVAIGCCHTVAPQQLAPGSLVLLLPAALKLLRLWGQVLERKLQEGLVS